MSDGAAPADAAVLDALESGDGDRRRAELETLVAARRPLSTAVAAAVVRCLGDRSKAVQRRAADALRESGAAGRPDVVTALRRAAGGDDPRVRWGATFALGQLGIAEPSMLPALVEAMGSDDGDRRWAAASIAIACGRANPAAVGPALLEARACGGPALRKMALYVLRDLAPGTPDVTAALIASLRDPDVGVRLAALSGLCRLEPPPATACELVLDLVSDDPDPGLRRAALSALGHVGRGVAAVRDVLDAAAASDDPAVRRAAAIARARLDAALPARR